jgi:hypothetical protein
MSLVSWSRTSSRSAVVVLARKPNGVSRSVFIMNHCGATSLTLAVGVQMVFVAIILAMVYNLPESPRWLLAHGREDEAKHVLSMLNDHDIHEEYEEIRTSIQAEQAAQVSWSQMFEGGLGTRRVLLGMVLQFAQQLSGVNALGMYPRTNALCLRTLC